MRKEEMDKYKIKNEKIGFIYIARSSVFPKNWYKIGQTCALEERMKSLSEKISSNFECTITWVVKNNDILEKKLHNMYYRNNISIKELRPFRLKTCSSKEIFNIPIEKIIKDVNKLIFTDIDFYQLTDYQIKNLNVQFDEPRIVCSIPNKFTYKSSLPLPKTNI